MNKNIQKINNQLAASILFEKNEQIDDEENLKTIHSSFIKIAVKKNILSITKTKSELVKREPQLIRFAIAVGSKRAVEAIETAFSSLLFNNAIIENTKSISLLISSHNIPITLDEIGEINDYIQEKTGYTADIVMSINEDKNLGKALAVTILFSRIEFTTN